MMNQTGMLESNGTNQYTHVRVWASAVDFVILFFFNLVINWTIVREARLRGHARFVLVFHLLLSATVYFAVCFVFYLQIHVHARLTAPACAALITLLATSASNILLTITAMALDRYMAICFPLKYSSVRVKSWPWFLGVLTWALASIIPLSIFPQVKDKVDEPNMICDRQQLKYGEIHKIVLISICTVLILYSYVRIMYEGRRLGVLNRRNQVGCRTITLHGAQLAVYILPNFMNFLLKKSVIQQDTKELCGVITFVFFSLAQCIAPIVYGLRKEELLEHLRLQIKNLLEWTVNINRPPHQSRYIHTITLYLQVF